jgi:hypothetical protein
MFCRVQRERQIALIMAAHRCTPLPQEFRGGGEKFRG